MSIKTALYKKWGQNLIGKDDKLALDMFDRAIKLDSHDCDAYIMKSGVLLRTGRVVDALKILDQAIEANPGKTKEIGEIDELRIGLRKILVEQPSSVGSVQKATTKPPKEFRVNFPEKGLSADIIFIEGRGFDVVLASALTGEKRSIASANNLMSAQGLKDFVHYIFTKLPKNLDFKQAVATLERIAPQKNGSDVLDSATHSEASKAGLQRPEETQPTEIPF